MVPYADFGTVVVPLHIDVQAITVAQAVVDQVAQCPAQGQGFGFDDQRVAAPHHPFGDGGSQPLQQAVQGHVIQVFVNVGVAHGLQRVFHHLVELVQVFVKVGLQVCIFQQFGAQLESGNGRFQVV